MKVYLDDLRDTPVGFVRTYTVEETIELLKTRQVEVLSLDNDLGTDQPEGWTTLDWLEEVIYNDPTFPIPEMHVHSANSTRVDHMKRAILSIERIRQQQIGGE